MNGAINTRLAILGCGAIAEQVYLPALRGLRDVSTTVLADSDAPRRERLASTFNIRHTDSNFERCYDLFDAAIVILPNALRQSACIELLKRRKAVLVEQPIALSVAQYDDLVRASEQTNTPLLVGNILRFLWGHLFMRSAIDSQAYGRVERFDIRYGLPRDWPTISDFSFKEIAGGGALVDVGVRALDCVMHWLGDVSEIEYLDDAAGGVEANALLTLRLQNEASGVVELSRTRQLRNTAIVHFKHGVFEVGLDTNEAKLSFADQSYVFSGSVTNSKGLRMDQSHLELAKSQVEKFIGAIRTGSETRPDLLLARSTIGLIETCYRQRKPLRFPWAYGDTLVGT